jgi:hypothetical protein
VEDPARPGDGEVPDADAAVDDPDDAAAIAYSLSQTVESRLRGLRSYTRLLRELHGSGR